MTRMRTLLLAIVAMIPLSLGLGVASASADDGPSGGSFPSISCDFMLPGTGGDTDTIAGCMVHVS